MPYGFNDDKSKFNLANMGGSSGTFTPNVSTSAGVSSADVNVWKEGSIASISGTFVLVTKATSFPAMVTLGTIEDFKPVSVAGGIAVSRGENTGLPLTVSTTGVVQAQIPYSGQNGATFDMGVVYITGGE